MLKINSLMFDLDGTLVDSRQDIVDAVNFTLKSLGLKEKSFYEIVSFIGFGVKDLLRGSLGDENLRLLEKALKVFGGYYSGQPVKKVVLYPHVREILKYFLSKDKYIITNRNKDMALSTLEALGIGKFFRDVIGGDDETCLKPSACPFNRFFKRYKLSRNESMVIGDMNVDVLAGKRARVHTCAVTYGIGKMIDILDEDPEYIIDDLLELKKIIY